MYSLGAKYTTSKFCCQQFLKEKARNAKKFFLDERGDTTIIAIVLVLVVVIALAVVFRDNIIELANTAWDKVFGNSGGLSSSGNKLNTDSWNQGN